MRKTVLILAILWPIFCAVAQNEKKNGETEPYDDSDLFGKTSWEHAPSDYKSPVGLVRGAAFIDRILPMPVGTNELRSDVWGVANIKPRNVENGIEDPLWSYWCRSVIKDDSDGKYHLFGARWPENHPSGFDGWSDSRVFHAISESPTGPFKVIVPDIGPGHNVTLFRAKDGSYVIGHIRGEYVGKSVNGPWFPRELPLDFRGTSVVDASNNTYTSREDGSVLMINQPGRVFVSEDGLKPFRLVTNSHGGHPYTLGIFEDPIIWRDEVQYNVIFNDWYGRVAYYLRSKDGVNWVWDQGIAYDFSVAKHPDGTHERWYKYERPSVLVDEYGRATHLYFAVLGTRKDLDKANDGNTTKNIALPLIVQRRLEIMGKQQLTKATTIRLKIKAEPGFSPQTDVNVESLIFGAPSSVDYGKGLKAIKSEMEGRDMIVTFKGTSAGFKGSDYVGKMIGTDAGGKMLFGFVRLPEVSFNDPILNANRPEIKNGKALFVVENFGMIASVPGKVMLVLRKSDGKVVDKQIIDFPVIPAYGHVQVEVPTNLSLLRSNECFTAEYTFHGGGVPFVHKESFQYIDDTKNAEVPLSFPGQPGYPAEFEIAGGKFPGDKCIAVRSPSTITWLIDGSFSELSFILGAAKGSLGASNVEVWGDGKRIYESCILRPRSIYPENHAVNVSVKGVRRLSIVSNSFFVNDESDHSLAHVVYGEPKLIRSNWLQK